MFKRHKGKGNHQIISFLLYLFFLSSCAVVKTPYHLTSYYKNTVERLQLEKDSIAFSCNSLLAGFSRVSITPDDQMRVPMAGFGQVRTRFATGVHDSIFVRAVAIQTGERMALIVSADMLLMPPDIIDRVVERVAEKGIKRDQLFFSATHTHSSIGGWGYGLFAKLIAGKKDRSVKDWLVQKIEKAIVDASSGLKPASLATGYFSAPQFTINRLTHDPDQLNTDFNYLIILQHKGSKVIIGTYSAHATTIGRNNTLISGDYPGYWERSLENSGYALAMFCGGSMANQSPYGKGGIFESAEYIGSSLADSVKKKSDSLIPGETVTKASVSVKLDLPPYHIRMSKNRNFTTGVSRKMMPITGNVYLQALKINNLVWFFTPGDFSGESARDIKKMIRARGFDSAICGYNGGYIGYILPGKYFWLKHYESRKMSWFGPFLGDYMIDIMEKMSNLFTQ